MNELRSAFWLLGSALVGLLVLAVVSFLFSQRWGKLRGPAHAFAALRSLGALEDDALVKCPDDLAHLFAPSFTGSTSFVRKFGARFLYPGLYETVLATTKVFDTAFCELINQNHFKGDPTKQIQQVVVLDADYGTRLIRFSQLLKDRNVKAFEVDLFHYQQFKLKILKAAEKELKSESCASDGIVYCQSSVDDLSSLQGTLGSTFQASKPTLWVLEGVLPFLSSAEVDSLLTAIRAISGDNCCILSDVVPKIPAFTESMSSESYMYTQQAIAALRSLFPSSSEYFELNMTHARRWCRARGFELMKNMGPQAQQTHLIRLDGSTVGQVPDCLRVLVLASCEPTAIESITQKDVE